LPRVRDTAIREDAGTSGRGEKGGTARSYASTVPLSGVDRSIAGRTGHDPDGEVHDRTRGFRSTAVLRSPVHIANSCFLHRMPMEARLIVKNHVESTQDEARKLALMGEQEGLAIMALDQGQGRGRLGRSWVSPPGKNLALSLILRPQVPPGDATLLGMLASTAVAETLEIFGLTGVRLKWPNDVLLDGRKVAGILSEARVNGSEIEFVIIGIGLNVNTASEDFPPELRQTVTSMAAFSGREWDLNEVAGLLLDRIAFLYDRVAREGCRFVVPQWETRWLHRGRALVRDDTKGIAEGLTEDGALLLRTEEGSLVRIDSGEVNLAS
jgi:BirA family biotin operon repressor/biotin-[acetyl-CoA-carboxylase] ligase